MALVVAPLTSTLMGSIPARNTGLGSAINNALSRVGQPLLGAVIFIAITASFYTSLAAKVPGLDPTDPAVRSAAASSARGIGSRIEASVAASPRTRDLWLPRGLRTPLGDGPSPAHP